MKSKKNVYGAPELRLIYLFLLVALVLLNNDSIKSANGQLEAVGAVLSVVPVTSILATAGLVGVKLAALSRLLKVLGYDQAYLANVGGHGTAAAPIGLQTNYAYMFPYVPGLNISVKGESGTNYENLAQQQREAAFSSTTRKTFPAMGLPGDYESQNKPFRGSESLREIFRDSGVQMRFPTSQQQQQAFNGAFPKATTPIYNPLNENTNVSNNNNQRLPQLQPQPQPQPPMQPQPQSQHSNPPSPSNNLAPIIPPPSSSSSFDTTNSNAPNQPKLPDDMGWPQQPTINHNQQPANHPPSSSNSRVPVQPDQQHQTRPQNQVHPPQRSHSSHSHQPSQNSQVSKSLNNFEIHAIPQHEYFQRKILESKSRITPTQPEALPSGQLIRRPETLPPHSETPTTFEDYERIMFGTGHSSSPQTSGPIVGNLINNNNSGLTSADLTTNIVPLPYSNEGPPPFHDDMDHNEFLLVTRRKRRDVSNQSAPETPKISLGTKILAASGQQPINQSGDTFGMPAVNINPMRRKKRSLSMKILSAINYHLR